MRKSDPFVDYDSEEEECEECGRTLTTNKKGRLHCAHCNAIAMADSADVDESLLIRMDRYLNDL